MLKIVEKIEFSEKDNKMKSVADTATAKKKFFFEQISKLKISFRAKI